MTVAWTLGEDPGAEWFDVYVAWFRAMAVDFVEMRMRSNPSFPAEPWLTDLILDLVVETDYVRAVCGYAGWLCGQKESEEAGRAAVGLELMYLSASVHDESGTDAGVIDAIGGVLLNWSERLLQEQPRIQEIVRDWRDEITAVRLAEATGLGAAGGSDSSIARSLQLGATLAGCTRSETTALAVYGASVARILELEDGTESDDQVDRLLDAAVTAVTGRLNPRGERLLLALAGWLGSRRV